MTFAGYFFLLVLITGGLELYLLVKVAAGFGVLLTIFLCVLTGMIGGSLVRHQGMETWFELNRELAQGRAPAETIVSGIALIMVGVLLITPGFITDTLGFLLLVPPLRKGAARLLVARFKNRVQVMHGGQFPPGNFPGGFPPGFQTGPFPPSDEPEASAKIIDVDPE